VPLEDSIGALATLKSEGKIRHIGVCNISEPELRRAQSLTPIVSAQNRYNVSDRSSESLLDLCDQERLAFLPWAPILGIEPESVVADIAAHHGSTPRQVVLAWLLARSPSMLPIPGTGSIGHLEENVAAARIELHPDEVASLNQSGS
jgi:aryl-alcohol dehydrogenase-like predicted oxidoreductase